MGISSGRFSSGPLFAWEGLGLARVSGYPTLSDVFRLIMRYPVGRWALFALWLWVGLAHLRPGLALPAEGLIVMTSGLDAPVLASPVIRQALVPMAAFYLILMAALGLGLLGLHRRGAGHASGPAAVPDAPRGWAALTRHVPGTTNGGYLLLLLAVVAAYYYGVARMGGTFLDSAVMGTALLIGLTMPMFAAVSWISARAHSRSEKPGKAQPPPQ